MPQAILKQDVETLGARGDVVEVAAGYLRNFLIPRDLAELADRATVAAARKRMEEEERARLDLQRRSAEYAALLNKTVLTLPQRAGQDGRLYGSVTSQEIVDAIRAARDIRIDKRKVRLEDPIKQLGTHMVEVEITTGVVATIKTIVVEQAQ